MLSSDEQFGYDPVTTEFPLLRKAQNYGSLVADFSTGSGALIGGLVTPAECRLTTTRATIQIEFGSDLRTDALLSDARRCGSDERLLWRCGGRNERVVVVPAHCLVDRNLSEVDAVFVGDQLDQSACQTMNISGLIPNAESTALVNLGSIRVLKVRP